MRRSTSQDNPSPVALGPEAKRRKVRKGTRSCWECKRRKLKCLYEHESVVCTGCRSRRIKCVSQDFPEEVSEHIDKARQMRERVVRVEDRLERLLEKVAKEERVSVGSRSGGGKFSEDGGCEGTGLRTPASIHEDDELALLPCEKKNLEHHAISERTFNILLESHQPSPLQHALTRFGENYTLSYQLLSAFPSEEDIQIISSTSGETPVLSTTALKTEHLLRIPKADQHPTLVAKYMLTLATYLQHVHPTIHSRLEQLSEPPREIAKRLAKTAAMLITTNDELVTSIEGLECIILESEYHLNWGNLRKSLISNRRAITFAQIMGLHRSVPYRILDRRSAVKRSDPLSFWFQLLHCDRSLCLLLGLPQASADQRMGSDAVLAGGNKSPLVHLEWTHNAIASRILSRNDTQSNSEDFAQTQAIDLDLQRAAKIMPSTWWLTPNFSSTSHNPETLHNETHRLMVQMRHYNLLNQLHLSYMLLHQPSHNKKHEYQYSKMMCVTASRELLARFIAFRNYNRICSSYRVVSFLGLEASMTLILAHIDSYQHQHQHSTTPPSSSPLPNNILAHQSPLDRATISQVADLMISIGTLNNDRLGTQSGDCLRVLAAIELQVADGTLDLFSASSSSAPAVVLKCDTPVVDPDSGEVKQLEDDDDNRFVPGQDAGSMMAKLCCSIQSARLSREKEILMAKSNSDPNAMQKVGTQIQHSGLNNSNNASESSDSFASHQASETLSMLHAASGTYGQQTQLSNDAISTAQFAPQFPDTASPPDGLLSQYQYPDLMAGVEDWAFQGIDMAFLDSVTRGSGSGSGFGDIEGGEKDWLMWPGHV